MRYSVQPRNQIFVKEYVFLSSAKKFARTIGKNISNILSGNYYQKLLDHESNLPHMRLKLLQKEQFKERWRQLVI